MKEGKQECEKPKPPPKPNFKNKDFAKWQRAETCKTDDNLISTDWHERLQRTPLFTPVYDNCPTNMVYLLSGEYGRMWQKERDEWYSKVFVPRAKERDFNERKKKIRKEAREAKKAAEINIQERKARKAKEAEEKAKAELEKQEKLRAKIQKCVAMKKTKKKKETKAGKEQNKTEKPVESKDEECPKGWTAVELTVQCECSQHNEDQTKKEEEGNQQMQQEKKNEASPTLCEDYVTKLAGIQNKKDLEAAV